MALHRCASVSPPGAMECCHARPSQLRYEGSEGPAVACWCPSCGGLIHGYDSFLPVLSFPVSPLVQQLLGRLANPGSSNRKAGRGKSMKQKLLLLCSIHATYRRTLMTEMQSISNDPCMGGLVASPPD